MRNNRFVSLASVLALGFLFNLAGQARAETLSEALGGMLKTHERIKAAKADSDAANERIYEARGGYFPTVQFDGHYGYERQSKDGSDVTGLPTRRIAAKVTQILWDAGKVKADIGAAKYESQLRNEVLRGTRQGLLLEGIEAYVQLRRTVEVLGFARRSEANIKKQAILETARVEVGRGYSTDVLQAKTQLAGAEARRVRAQGALIKAQNRYAAVFSGDGVNVDSLNAVVVPAGLIPESLGIAIQTAEKSSPDLAVSKLTADIRGENLASTRADLFSPKVKGVLSADLKNDFDGVSGASHDYMARLEVSYPFGLGFTSLNTDRAAVRAKAAAKYRSFDMRRLVSERVRNQWQDLLTAKGNTDLLEGQAGLAAEFLTLARKEHQLGKRSLLDILNGETKLNNAQSDAAAARADIVIAAYGLLRAMGVLDLQSVSSTETASRPTETPAK